MPNFMKVKKLLKLPSLQEKFDKRADAVLENIKKMPQGNAYTGYLAERLSDARKLSKTDLQKAYDELKTIKSEVVKALNGYSDGPSVDNLARMIDKLSQQGDAVSGRFNQVTEGADAIYNKINDLPDPKKISKPEEKLALKKQVPDILHDKFIMYMGHQFARKQVLDFLLNTDVPKSVASLERQIGLLPKNKKKEADGLTKSLQVAHNKFRIRGKTLTHDHALTVFQAQQDKYQEMLKKWANGFGATDAKPGSRVYVEELERQRLEQASWDYMISGLADETMQLTTEEPKRAPTDLVTWEGASCSTDFTSKLLPKSIEKMTESDIGKACDNVRKKTGKLIEDLTKGGVDSDVVFDLSLKSEVELKRYFATSFGLPAGKATSLKEKLCESLAKAMAEEIRKANPNKASKKMSPQRLKKKPGTTCDVPESITIKGLEYKNPKVIGEGGLGAITEYTDKDGNPVIVKTAKIDPGAENDEREEKRQAMVMELKMHRQIMGGQAGGGHENVVAMKGVVVSDDGSMHMVMEKADGGDCDRLAHALQVATDQGVLPQEVRDALNRDFIAQAIKGMRHMQEQNMLHHDIKPENYLVDGKGTVKLSDFGSAQSAGEDGTVLSNPEGREIGTTKEYAAPEMQVGTAGARVNGKADTYTLGTMIAMMTSASHGFDRWQGKTALSGSLDFTGKTNSTALDRMVNAMLDPDPAKRPTLEAVEAAAYLDQSDQGDEAALREIRELSVQLAKAIGGTSQEKMTEINEIQIQEINPLETALHPPDEPMREDQVPSSLKDSGVDGLLKVIPQSIRTIDDKYAEVLAHQKANETDECLNKLIILKKTNIAVLGYIRRARDLLGQSPNPDKAKADLLTKYWKHVEEITQDVVKLQRARCAKIEAEVKAVMNRNDVKAIAEKLKEASANLAAGKSKSILHEHYTPDEIKAFKEDLRLIEQRMAAIPDERCDDFDAEYRRVHAIIMLEKVANEKAVKDLDKDLGAIAKKLSQAERKLKKDYDARRKELGRKAGQVSDLITSRTYEDALNSADRIVQSMMSYRAAFDVLDRMEQALKDGVPMTTAKVGLA